MRVGLVVVAMACGMALFTSHERPVAAQEVIDRVLAVVDGEIITLSDVRGALALGLVPAPPSDADAVRTTMSRLIDRELMIREVQRYLPQEPAPGEVDRRLGEVRAKFPGTEAFDAAAMQMGFDPARLTEWIRNDLRIDQYLRERFASAGQLTDAEVDAYLQEHQAELMPEGRSLADAQDLARRTLAAERRESVVAEWLASLRRRTDVMDLYITPQG
jgi:hypothetical protein